MNYLAFILIGAILASGVVADACNIKKDQKQLSDAINTAIIHIIDSQYFWTDVISHVFDFTYYVSDCYAQIEYYPYPDKPIGIFKKILDTGKVLVARPPSGGIYTTALENMLTAVWADIGQHYGANITFEYVYAFGNDINFQRLYDGEVDMIDMVASIGGIWDDSVRRREEFLPSCALFSNLYRLRVREDSPYQTLTDVINAPNTTICINGQNSGITGSTFKNSAIVRTFSPNYDNFCNSELLAGNVSAYFTEQNGAGEEGLRVIETHILAPASYWVARR